jgi:uncharacterized protein YbjT (DUF2867 family)
MAAVLVTGGTGTLGRQLVPGLRGAGHHVRVLSRRAGPDTVVGDLQTGTGLAAALDGIDTVVHAATNPARAKRTDVAGTRNLVEAAKAAGGSHMVYVSIVGVDRHPLPYYKAKWEAEKVVEGSALPWTIFRAVQFHELLDKAFGMMRPVLVAPRHFRFQLLAASEAAARLVELVDAGTTGRAPDMGGPEVRFMDDLARVWRRARHKRRPILRPPVPGRIGRAFRDGVTSRPSTPTAR